MKSLMKRIFVFAGSLLATTAFVLLGTRQVKAEALEAGAYFYNQISKDTRAGNFYQAFNALDEMGEFKKGKVEYDLISKNVVSTHDVEVYVNNADQRVPKAYGMGRDAYIMDHPDLFYVDLFQTSISAGQQGKDYVAYLDTSRALSLYLGDFNTEEKVKSAIETYEKKLNEIVTKAKAAGGVLEQITFVNKYIADHTEYSFGTVIKDGKNVDTKDAAYISTAYGSLVNGKAICGGYAKGFKAVMDRLGIPCVCVQGYSLSSNSSAFQAHMWNYVELDGIWYAVDPTWNDTTGNLTQYLLVGGNTLFATHMEDGVISSSGFELNYPAIKPYDYGNDTDDNGMVIEGEYFESPDQTGKHLTLTVSFDDKGAQTLREEGKYLVCRYGEADKNKEVVWGVWFDCISAVDIFMLPVKFNETNMEMVVYAHTEYVQFALVNYAPDESNGAFYPDKPEYGENAGKELFYFYNDEKLTDEHFIGAKSIPYHNNGYGSYVSAPGATAVTPSNSGTMAVDKTYNITIKYSETLTLAEDKTLDDVELDFYTSRGADTIKDHAIVSNFKWDGDKTISFTFTPSKMFIHNQAMYYFTPANLIGIESGKIPEPVTFSFKGKSVVCSKIFNDGRLYMSVFGQPKMLDDSDLSITDFKDENGNYYAESQRSQLLLVVNKPSKVQEDKMDEVLKRDTPIQDSDIVSSSTYEIDLQICGIVHRVPNGSYMQVAFGFPEGYSPDDAGTTFKIYHYKHDNKGNITGVEEIPAIITEYGLIAQVKSFSPFTIVQIKNSSAAVSKNSNKSIYASVIGNGGTISTQKAEGKSGIDTLTSDSITYAITANDGYQIASVKLNGKVIDASKYSNGTLTLSKEELEASNMLEVSFITKEAVKSYADRGIEIADTEMTISSDLPKSNSNVLGIALGSSAAILVLVGGTVAIVFILKKNKKSEK